MYGVEFYQSEAIIGARGGFVCQVSGALSDLPSKASNFLQIFHYICGKELSPNISLHLSKEWIFSKYFITFVQVVDAPRPKGGAPLEPSAIHD